MYFVYFFEKIMGIALYLWHFDNQPLAAHSLHSFSFYYGVECETKEKSNISQQSKREYLTLLSCKKFKSLCTVCLFVWIANRVCVALMAVACEKIRSTSFSLFVRVHILLGATCTLSHRIIHNAHTHIWLFAIGAYLSAHSLPLLMIIMPGCIRLSLRMSSGAKDKWRVRCGAFSIIAGILARNA